MGDKKYPLEFYFLFLISYFLFLTFFASCGSRGDPKPPEPYREVGVVKDLKASRRDDGIYLTWRMPKAKDFPTKAIKGFVILRAEVPQGVRVEDANYLSIDFIVPGKGKVFEYIDKDTRRDKTYAYKIVTMDKNARMSRDSKIAIVIGERAEIEERQVHQPEAPTGLLAVYASKSIILTWDEVSEVRLYRVYRSIVREATEGFVLIGETVTPAFTDRDVEPSKKYYYRVTATGQLEGPSSGVIEVTTEAH